MTWSCRSELQTQAIKYSHCLILKILRLQKQLRFIVEFRKALNNLFILSSPKLKNKFPRKTAVEKSLLTNTSDDSVVKMTFFFTLFKQQQTHSYVKISQPFLMKRLENVVSRTSSGGQRIPRSSSTGNPMPTIIWGWFCW